MFVWCRDTLALLWRRAFGNGNVAPGELFIDSGTRGYTRAPGSGASQVWAQERKETDKAGCKLQRCRPGYVQLTYEQAWANLARVLMNFDDVLLRFLDPRFCFEAYLFLRV